MPTVMSTLKAWADGYSALTDGRGRLRAGVEQALEACVAPLRRQPSLADLAEAYWQGDQIARVAEEMHPDASLAPVLRDAAYWLRFMEIRHRRKRRGGASPTPATDDHP